MRGKKIKMALGIGVDEIQVRENQKNTMTRLK
jgi:hypothetical protein